MRIVVVALGKIGLPLAVQFASKGHQVVGVDVNQSVVDDVSVGIAPFPGEADLQSRLSEVVKSRHLRATTDYATAIPDADVVVVVVPLFVDEQGKPDFASMDSATRSIAVNLSKDTLVIYETTLPVGTTRNRWKPSLEVNSGFTESVDFHVVFSPERVLTGRVFADLRKYPKLVGGLSREGCERAIAFYESALDFDDRPDLDQGNGVWDLGSPEASELAKLAETTYRDVNIGLANQFALHAEKTGIDIYRVIEAANSQPYSHIHRPGIAVGGHCIPVYPQLYLWNHPGATIVQAARRQNVAMPKHAVDLLTETHGDLHGARVVVLGASYRGGVKETAFSGVYPTVKALQQAGASVHVHDPLYADQELRDLGFEPYLLGTVIDLAVVQSDHSEYKGLTDKDLPGVKVIVDGRRVLTDSSFPGTRVLTLGGGQNR